MEKLHFLVLLFLYRANIRNDDISILNVSKIFCNMDFLHLICSPKMVDVAQLVRALDCGSRGRRFKSGLPPQTFEAGTQSVLAFLLTGVDSLLA